MTNSMWVTLDFFFSMQSHEQQDVSGTVFFSLPCSFTPMITNRKSATLHFSFLLQSHFISSHGQQYVSGTAFLFTMQSPMTSLRLWVILHIFSLSVTLDLIPWPTGCEWHHIGLIAFHHMTNRMWVTLHFSPYSAVSWLLPIVCETFFTMQSHAFHHMANRMWVTLHFSPYPHSLIAFIPTECEWHCISFFPCSLIILSYD